MPPSRFLIEAFPSLKRYTYFAIKKPSHLLFMYPSYAIYNKCILYILFIYFCAWIVLESAFMTILIITYLKKFSLLFFKNIKLLFKSSTDKKPLIILSKKDGKYSNILGHIQKSGLPNLGNPPLLKIKPVFKVFIQFFNLNPNLLHAIPIPDCYTLIFQ